MHTLLGYVLAFQNVAEHEVVVHRVSDDFGDGRGSELEKREVLGFACGAVAGEA